MGMLKVAQDHITRELIAKSDRVKFERWWQVAAESGGWGSSGIESTHLPCLLCEL